MKNRKKILGLVAGLILLPTCAFAAFRAAIPGLDFYLSSMDLATNVTGILAIANGGTSADSAQGAINALTQAAGAGNEYVLTKDTASGNAIFKAAAAGLFTNSAGTTYLTTTADLLVHGASTAITNAFHSIVGNADLIQLAVKGHSTQTQNIFAVLKSDNTVLFSINNSGQAAAGGTTPKIGSNTASTALLISTAYAPTVSTLTDGATVALDASLGNDFKLSAGGNRTILAPTNATAGQVIVIRHSASGADRTLTLTTGSSGAFRFGTDITALTATSSGKTDYISAKYNSTDSRWDVLGVKKGY